MIGGWDTFCEIALRRMSLDLTDDKSTLVQVMAWCRQAPSHYLSQCWPRSLSPYDITRPQWVNRRRWVSHPTFRGWSSSLQWFIGITWANVDLDPCCHMTSLGHNELNGGDGCPIPTSHGWNSSPRWFIGPSECGLHTCVPHSPGIPQHGAMDGGHLCVQMGRGWASLRMLIPWA